MKKLILTIVTSIVLSGFAFNLAAAEAAPAEAPGKTRRAGYIPYRGTVNAVDAAAKTVSLKGSTKDRVFVVTTDTTITKNGSSATLNDVAAGDYVAGSYKENNGKLELRSLKVGQAPQKKQK